MGSDNLATFKKWKNWEEMIKHHQLYVYPRVYKNHAKSKFHDHQKVQFVNAPIVEISSTFIRKCIKDRKNITPLLPKSVWIYLDEMNFYK